MSVWFRCSRCGLANPFERVAWSLDGPFFCLDCEKSKERIDKQVKDAPRSSEGGDNRMYRKLEIEGKSGTWTPLNDVANESGRAKATPRNKAKELGLEMVIAKSKAADGRQRRLCCIPSSDVPSLLQILSEAKRYKPGRVNKYKRRTEAKNGVEKDEPQITHSEKDEPRITPSKEAIAPRGFASAELVAAAQKAHPRGHYDKLKAIADIKSGISALKDGYGLSSLTWDSHSGQIRIKWAAEETIDTE